MAKVKQLVEQLLKLDQEADIFGKHWDELSIVYAPTHADDKGESHTYQLRTRYELEQGYERWYVPLCYANGEEWEYCDDEDDE